MAKPTPDGGLSTLFVRNPYLLILSIVVLLMGGISSLLTLPRLEDPRIANRDGVVVTPMPGASAERVESLVTEVLEESLQEVAEIQTLESTSRAGVSLLRIKMIPSVDESNNQEVYAEIRDQLAEATRLLPPEALEPQLDDKRDPAGFTLIVALRGAADGAHADGEIGILQRMAEDLADRLRQVSGTELVRLFGSPEEEITVTVDAAELAELGLDASAVAARVAAADSRGSAGVLRGSGQEMLIEVAGELDSLSRVAAVPLVEMDGRLVRLGDIAEVRRQARQPAQEIALIDGDPAVLVAARMKAEMRIDSWARGADAVVERFTSEAGTGLVVEPIFRQEGYTSRQLSDLGANLLAGAAVVVAVILVLMGWRLALVVGLALPLVMSAVLLGWKIQGGALHQMSIFGMIIGLGLLIDNAIVVADEVAKERASGFGPAEAVSRAVHHLFYPLLASTLTTVLAFAPILLLTGSVGDFVGSIGGSVILSITASLAIALTITAALAGRVVLPRPAPGEEGGRWWRHGVASQALSQHYRRALQGALGRPIIALGLALILPVCGFLLAGTLGNEFFPPVDRDMLHVQVWLPNGTPIDATRAQAEAIGEAITALPETRRVDWLMGGSFPSVYYNLVMRYDQASHYAHGIVTAGSSAEARHLIDTLQGPLDAQFPGAQIVVKQFAQGPPVDADVELRLLGQQLDALYEVGEQVRIALLEHPDVLHTQTSMPRGEPKLWVQADEDEARLAGLPLTAVAGQLQSNLEGALGGRMVEGPEQLPVRIRYSDAKRGDLSTVAALPLVRPGDTWTTLPAVGDMELRPEVAALTRYDGERSLEIKGFTRRGALPLDVTSSVMERLQSDLVLPAGFRLEVGGQAQEDAAAKAGLAANAPLLGVMMIATLILAFRSVRLAGVLGAVAILSVGLGFLSTAMIGFPISFNTMLGILGLIGVSLNDSIVVLAAIRSDPKARHGDVDATVEAVMGSTRHVLSTTLTTIGGFLPLLLFVGGDFWPSLAIVLVGGIAGATLIALAFIPACHLLIERPRPTPDAATPRRGWGGRLGRTAQQVSAVLAGIWLVGCTVGPDYVTPKPTTPEAFVGAQVGSEKDPAEPATLADGSDAPAANDAAAPPPEAAWWRVLGDPVLDELVDAAVAGNLDLQVAAARVRQARAARRAAVGEGRPNVSAAASGLSLRQSENGFNAGLLENGLSPRDLEDYDVGVETSWELDLFGRVRRTKEAATARLESSEEARRGVLLAVVSDVVGAYSELRGAQRRLALAEKNVELLERTHRLVADRHRIGLASGLDLQRATSQLAATRALLPPLRAAQRQHAHRLAVLSGKPPTELLDRLMEVNAEHPKALPDLVPVGLPSDLLRRRPDIRAAERQLAAATADIGIRTADLYPRFSLTGAFGLDSASFADLFEGASGVWALGPRIAWPIFQGGRLRAAVGAAEAARDAAYGSYRQTVLRSLEEVENGLVAYAEEELRRRQLAESAAAADRAVQLANTLYDKGLDDYLTVLDAERTLVSAEDRMAISETAVMLRWVGLYRALGGGWEAVDGDGPDLDIRPAHSQTR